MPQLTTEQVDAFQEVVWGYYRTYGSALATLLREGFVQANGELISLTGHSET